jgi:hypothetical protein
MFSGGYTRLRRVLVFCCELQTQDIDGRSDFFLESA